MATGIASRRPTVRSSARARTGSHSRDWKCPPSSSACCGRCSRDPGRGRVLAPGRGEPQACRGGRDRGSDDGFRQAGHAKTRVCSCRAPWWMTLRWPPWPRGPCGRRHDCSPVPVRPCCVCRGSVSGRGGRGRFVVGGGLVRHRSGRRAGDGLGRAGQPAAWQRMRSIIAFRTASRAVVSRRV